MGIVQGLSANCLSFGSCAFVFPAYTGNIYFLHKGLMVLKTRYSLTIKLKLFSIEDVLDLKG